jgi:hypothetical protein
VLELALVLHEQPGKAGVVERALLGQLGDRSLGLARLDPTIEQVPANLGDRPLTAVDVAVGQRQRFFQLRGYAARPSTFSTDSTGASGVS